MLYTKEFYEIMESFERYAKKEIRVGSQGFNKEPKENWVKKYYYSDGVVNDSFKIYLSGYCLGKSIFQNN